MWKYFHTFNGGFVMKLFLCFYATLNSILSRYSATYSSSYFMDNYHSSDVRKKGRDLIKHINQAQRTSLLFINFPSFSMSARQKNEKQKQSMQSINFGGWKKREWIIKKICCRGPSQQTN